MTPNRSQYFDHDNCRLFICLWWSGFLHFFFTLIGDISAFWCSAATRSACWSRIGCANKDFIHAYWHSGSVRLPLLHTAVCAYSHFRLTYSHSSSACTQLAVRIRSSVLLICTAALWIINNDTQPAYLYRRLCEQGTIPSLLTQRLCE